MYTGDTRLKGATTIADMGQQGAWQSGQFRTRGAEGAADYMTQGANAQAGAKIAKGNAWTNAISSGANAAGDYFSMRNINAGNKRRGGTYI